MKALQALILSMVLGTVLATPLRAQVEYTATDITNWTPAQLDAMPFFEHYVPYRPAGTSSDFTGTARTAQVIVGYLNINPYTSTMGVYYENGVQNNVPALGTFAWSRTWWDGTDYHFQNGFVTKATLADINSSGLAVGESTLTGNGTYAYQATVHAMLYDPEVNAFMDLTPAATSSNAVGINDFGVVTGSINLGGGTQAYRQYSDGSRFIFGTTSQAPQPSAINNSNWSIGSFTVSSKRHAFLQTGTQSLIDLGMPSQGSPDTANPKDLNNHGQIVGTSYQVSNSTEKNGCIWYRENGSWIAEDLNEILITGNIIIEDCVAINEEGHVIAIGHEDGTDLFGSKRYLLTPDILNPPAPVANPIWLSIARLGNGSIQLDWNSAGPGFAYMVESKTNMNSPTWQALSGGSWPTTAQSFNWQPDGQTTQQLFRVVTYYSAP